MSNSPGTPSRKAARVVSAHDAPCIACGAAVGLNCRYNDRSDVGSEWSHRVRLMAAHEAADIREREEQAEWSIGWASP